jgi:hypothetical protein
MIHRLSGLIIEKPELLSSSAFTIVITQSFQHYFKKIPFQLLSIIKILPTNHPFSLTDSWAEFVL